MKTSWFHLLCALLAASCQALNTPTATLSATPTERPTATVTPSPTQAPPTATATHTPTMTLTPSITPTPSVTPTPTLMPEATIGFVFDNWKLAEVPADILDTLRSPVLAFVNQNDRDGVGDRRTPQPATGRQTFYYVPPTNSAGRIPILDLPSSTGTQIFISRNGRSIAYFLQDSAGLATGLYVMDLESKISARILPLLSLVQRGIVTEPTWAPDGTRMAIALATGYDMDIFAIRRDGSGLENLTRNGSYDFWPVWSPDGRRIAFVSDRDECPTRIPGEPGACDSTSGESPTGGHVYVLDVNGGSVDQLSDVRVGEPPVWVNSSTIAYASGDPTQGDPERTLWIADINTRQAQEVRLKDGGDGPIRLSESWAPDASAVVYQSASNEATEIIVMRADGTLIGRTSELSFPRFGMQAAWAPDGSRVAFGGVNGQCPYGARVVDSTLTFVARGTPPPSMCNPTYSSDGLWLAFTGVNPSVDGRVDVYVANTSGFSSVNLTGSLRGTISLLGWVGGV